VTDNLYNLLRERFPRDLSQTFLETEAGVSYSYRDLDQQTSSYASFFTEKGLAKGDRLVAQVDKSPQALMLCLACIRAGLIFVPLNPAYRKNELRFLLADAQPSAVICRPEALAEIAALTRELEGQIPHPRLATLDDRGNGTLTELCDDTPPTFDATPCDGSDVAALMYTSGTTGQPKGAMITHRNLVANITALHSTWRWRSTDVLLHSLPLYHFHGLFIACLTALFGGTKIFFLPKFDADAVIARLPQATVFMGVPTYYTRLLEHPLFGKEFGKDACRTMRLFISGSAPLLAQTFRAFQERSGFPILERYGMTEAGVITSNPVDGERVPGMVGAPLPGVSLRIVSEVGAVEHRSPDRKGGGKTGNVLTVGQVGEVEIKGDNVFSGYWRKPEETAALFTTDGFFRTGDLGRWEPNGHLAIVGRLTDLVITGGLNVYPKEIEMALDQFDGVAESAVIGVPHPDFGEAVIAVVVQEESFSRLTEESLLHQLKEVLANYKVPKRVFFTDHLPRNAMGKVQKNLLRSQPEYLATFASVRSANM
jgi:malonyl-CoA/methylmalonyl-CoA synthetase